MSRTKRKDETMHLRILGTDEREPMSAEEMLGDISHMVADALQARASLVKELGEGVEFEAAAARDRINRDGIEADLSAIRIGEYFKRLTEFNILQRVHRAIQSRVEGTPSLDRLNPDAGEA